jgi:hypothetical protein
MNAPNGYRFLVQFPDLLTEPEAWDQLWRMFGMQAVAVARIIAGSEKAAINGNSTLIFSSQRSGWTVYVPVDWRVS